MNNNYSPSGQVEIFKNVKFGEIRTVISKNGVPLFIGNDACRALGYSNTRDATSRHVDPEDRADVVIHDGSQNRQMVAINESGIYSLIFGSKLESAKQFKKWVTSEVLPSIRKHGVYATPATIDSMLSNPDAMIAALTQLKQERSEKERLLAQNDLQVQELKKSAPKVKYYDDVISSGNGHTATTIAAPLNMSAQALNKVLKAAKVIRVTGREISLMASHQGKGYATTPSRKYVNSKGENCTRIDLQWTEKGRELIIGIVEKAKDVGMLYERKGRWYFNEDWIVKSKK